MPNHVTNIVSVTGPKEDIKDILSSLRDEEGLGFDFNKIKPMPVELEGTRSPSEKPNKELIKKFGSDNWYDWCLANWGTKWNAYDVSIIDDTEVSFDTAWSCADVLIHTLSKQHPTAKFELTYADEDVGSNCGIITYEGGEQISYIDKSMNHNDKEEAIRWAMNVKYGNDDDYEEWYGEEEEEDEQW